MLLMQKSLLYKLGLGGDKWGDDFNKSAIFVKSSTPSVYIGGLSKLNEAQLRKTKTFGRQ